MLYNLLFILKIELKCIIFLGYLINMEIANEAINKNNNNNNNYNNYAFNHLDKTDFRIVSLLVGNSDVVSEFVFDNSEDLIDIIAAIKEIQGVEQVVWSEEIYKIKTAKENVIKSFNKYWKDNNNMNYKKINGIRR